MPSELGISKECCPFCGDFVGIQVTSNPDDEVMEGLLVCSSFQCTQERKYHYVVVGAFSGDQPQWASAPTLGPEVVRPTRVPPTLLIPQK